MHKYEILQGNKKKITFILILYFIYFLKMSFYKNVFLLFIYLNKFKKNFFLIFKQ